MHPPVVRHGPALYRIKVYGRLNRNWKDYFAGMRITSQGGETLLSGPVPDQAALHGILNRIRDLNLVLVSLERQAPPEDSK